MKIDIKKLELGFLFILALYLQFTTVNVNPTLGQIYVTFMILSAVFIILDPQRSIPLKKGNDSTFVSLVKGAGAYVILLVVGNYIIVPGIKVIQNLIGSTTPALASSPILNNINFGGVIPFVETLFFFAVGLDFLASIFNVQINKGNLKSFKLWGIIIFISFAFMIFHLTAKGVSNSSTLAIVFFMAVISMVLVVWDESYESAIWLHIIANCSALFL